MYRTVNGKFAGFALVQASFCKRNVVPIQLEFLDDIIKAARLR